MTMHQSVRSPEDETPPDTRSIAPILAVWALGLALLPLYVTSSGRPQPAHIVLAVAFVMTQVQFGTYAAPFKGLVRACGAFVIVVAVVTVTWAIFAPADVSLFPPVFALFNFLVVRTCLILYSHLGNRFLAVTAYTLTATMAALSFYSLISGGSGAERSALTFNNPNQLAYFAVIGACAVVAVNLAIRLDWRTQLVGYASAIYLVTVANSKAGLMAMVIAVLLMCFTNIRVALAVAAIAIVLVVGTDAGTATYESVESRVTNLQSDDTLERRGYGLLTDHPQYVIVGAAEGYQERFDQPFEIHSTLGTVAFAYGIVGLVAFGLIFVRMFGLSGIPGLAVMAPVLVYGLTHNGLRFTPFWILVALTASIGAPSPSSQLSLRESA